MQSFHNSSAARDTAPRRDGATACRAESPQLLARKGLERVKPALRLVLAPGLHTIHSELLSLVSLLPFLNTTFWPVEALMKSRHWRAWS